tara:strand:- start:667 stop:1044 length:378 start_codon:yes stop_codon:yes gene_type:complete
MNEKVYVRKCERYTVWQATEPIEVDVEKLRKCEPPYIGQSEQDLLEYLVENVWNNEDFYSNDTNKEVYGEDEVYALSLEDAWEYNEPYSDSRDKYEAAWIDVGVPNEEYRKTGEFEIIATNVEDA